jgi:hypothetical protein
MVALWEVVGTPPGMEKFVDFMRMHLLHRMRELRKRLDTK